MLAVGDNMFERFDANNQETYPHNDFPKEKWYGKKEIPNIILTLCEGWAPELKECPKRIIYFDVLRNYYEEYNSNTGWKVVLDSALMSPSVYEAITDRKYKVFYTQAHNFWRNEKTGKDEGFIEPPRKFNKISIKHKLKCGGDPTDWYIMLWNEHPITSEKPDIPLEDVKL